MWALYRLLPRQPGHADASAAAIVAAIETVLKEGPRSRDMGGTASTDELGKAIAERL